MHAQHCGIVAAAVGFILWRVSGAGGSASSLWQSPRNLGQPAQPLARKRGARLFVVGFPDKLLPRNFTGIPIALQAVDAEGNRSAIQIFDLSEREMNSALGGWSIECDEVFWR